MRFVLTAVFVPVILIIMYLGYQKLPVIKTLSNCYQAATLAVDDKHIFAKRVNRTDLEICQERKDKLLPALQCFVMVSDKVKDRPWELNFYLQAARFISRSPQTIEEIVEDQNVDCPTPSTVLIFDQTTQTWY